MLRDKAQRRMIKIHRDDFQWNANFKHMKTKIILIIVIALLGITNIQSQTFEPKPVTITGKIRNYKGIYKTINFTYFHGVTRKFNEITIPLDEKGNFEFSFKIPHPIFHSATFDIQGVYHKGFIIEPNQTYNFEFDNKYIFITGESGAINRTIYKHRADMDMKLNNKIKESRSLYKKGLTVEEYIQKLKELEKERLVEFNNFCKTNILPEHIQNIVKSQIRFFTAHKWILYRDDPKTRKLRENLPKDFYTRLFAEYKIDKLDDICSESAMNYLSRIGTVYSQNSRKNHEGVIKLYEKEPSISKKFIAQYSKLINGDRSIAKDTNFRNSYKLNQKILQKIQTQYNLEFVAQSKKELQNPFMEDLVFSISTFNRFYRHKLLTDSNWEFIKSQISNQSVFNTLKIDYERKENNNSTQVKNKNILNKHVAKVTKKFIDKHKGKVIYIDFYSTWCGPCRAQIPHAKKLHELYHDKDVVFLNLCVRSKQKDWENMVAQYNLKGENFLLNGDEQSILEEKFKVRGYPTYVLIDKKGVVKTYNAPRPSQVKGIKKAIEELL
jgi:thiol-disulfide isomerase/thioredoxin